MDWRARDAAVRRNNVIIPIPGSQLRMKRRHFRAAASRPGMRWCERRLRRRRPACGHGTGVVSRFGGLQFQVSGARGGTFPQRCQLGASEIGSRRGLNCKHSLWGRCRRKRVGGAGVAHVVEVGGAGTWHNRCVGAAGGAFSIGVLAGCGGQSACCRPLYAQSGSFRDSFVGIRALFRSMKSSDCAPSHSSRIESYLRVR